MYTTVELAPRFRGKEVHQDSEKAAKNATEAVMKRISAEDPNRKSLSNCKSKMCFFHHCSNIIAKIKFNGLINKYWRSGPFREWARKLMFICFLPADDIKPTWINHFKPVQFQFSNFERRKVIAFKNYYEHQWINNTDEHFMSLFQIEVNTTNGNERFNKKLNKVVPANPSFWAFLDGVNGLLDQAVLEIARIDKETKVSRDRHNQGQDNLDHRKEAERRYLSPEYPDFKEMEFINYLYLHLGTKYVSQIKAQAEEGAPDMAVNIIEDHQCRYCLQSRNGENWVFEHKLESNKRTLHAKYCKTCKDTFSIGDPCPNCGVAIDDILELE